MNVMGSWAKQVKWEMQSLRYLGNYLGLIGKSIDQGGTPSASSKERRQMREVFRTCTSRKILALKKARGTEISTARYLSVEQSLLLHMFDNGTILNC